MQFSVSRFLYPYTVKGTLLTQHKFTRSLINVDGKETSYSFLKFDKVLINEDLLNMRSLTYVPG